MNAKYTGRIFDQIAVMSFMYSKSAEWNNYVLKEFAELLDEYKDVIDLADIGFPDDWRIVLSK